MSGHRVSTNLSNAFYVMKSVAMLAVVVVLGTSTGMSTLPTKSSFATGKAYGAAVSAAAKAKTPAKPTVKPAVAPVKKSNHGTAVKAVAQSKTTTGKAHGAAVSAVAKTKVPVVATPVVPVQK